MSILDDTLTPEERKKASQFKPDTARLAAIASAAVRRPLDKETDARKMYGYLAKCADLLANQLFTDPCKHCKRQGPENIRDLDSLTRSLQSIAETILEYAWGRPSTESASGRAGASVEDYKKAVREVKREDLSDYAPDDLPAAPSEELQQIP